MILRIPSERYIINKHLYMTITIVLISIIVGLLIWVRTLHVKNRGLLLEKSSLQFEKDRLDSIVKESKKLKDVNLIGRRALIHNHGLKYPNTDISFYVDYEVEIVDYSENKVKVAVIDFVPNCKEGREPGNKQGIIKHMQGQWIYKYQMELITDAATIRDAKLDKLGIK